MTNSTMKKLTLFTFLLLILNQAYSQDMITTSSDKVIKAKVVEVTSESVKYKKFDNPDGPTYTVNLSEIKKIKYANGDEDVFEPKATAKASSSTEGSTSNEGKETPAIFKGKFDTENEETHDYLEAIAKNAGTRLLEKCAGHMDNYTVEIFWDQTYRDDVEGVINLAIIVKWDKGLTNKQRWIRGMVKVDKLGKKIWSYQSDSGIIFSGCAKTMQEL